MRTRFRIRWILIHYINLFLSKYIIWVLKRKVLLSTQNICIEWRHVLKIITLGIKYTIVLLLLTGTTKIERLKPILSHVIRLRGNLIILIAKYCIFASKYKMQRPTFMGFLKTLHQRKEAKHYIALAKDKIEQHNQKWGFLGDFE